MRIYIVIKPEGARYIDKIFDELDLSPFEVKEAKIIMWKDVGKVIYGRKYSGEYYAGILGYLEITSRMFGENALAVLVEMAEEKYVNLIKKNIH